MLEEKLFIDVKIVYRCKNCLYEIGYVSDQAGLHRGYTDPRSLHFNLLCITICKD